MFIHKLLKMCLSQNRYSSNYTPAVLLNVANREKCMQKFQSMSIKQGSKHTKRKAAVLIPIFVNNDEISLLFTLRAAHLRSQGGQVSFPGGMQDETDNSTTDTALRETQEELGIDQEDIDIWGTGNPIIRQDMSIVPVVGCIKPNLSLDTLKINKEEVDQIFTVSIEKLCDPKFIKHTQFRGTYSTPSYLGGPYRIWGLTAVITFMFLKAFIPEAGYHHQVKYIPEVLYAIKKT